MFAHYLLLLNILLDTMPWCPTWRHWCCESNNRVCLLCSYWELGGWCNIEAWVYSVTFSISNKLIKIGFITIFKRRIILILADRVLWWMPTEANEGIILCSKIEIHIIKWYCADLSQVHQVAYQRGHRTFVTCLSFQRAKSLQFGRLLAQPHIHHHFWAIYMI